MAQSSVYSTTARHRSITKARIPKFAYDYFLRGAGSEICLNQNRQGLDAIKLLPKYFSGLQEPDIRCSLLGQTYEAPFGVAPIGFSDLIWPSSALFLAVAAKQHNVPYVLSTFSFSSPELIYESADGNAWLQLYVPKDPDIELAVINRAKSIGFKVLVVTVDCPTAKYRKNQSGMNFSLPLMTMVKIAMQVASRPVWAFNAMRGAGKSEFGMLQPFTPAGTGFARAIDFLTDVPVEHLTIERLKKIRNHWPGKLIVKGILAPEDAQLCASIGVDGIVVSNHGGRQLDAAPHALDVIADVRSAAGTDVAVLADGGVSSGLDVARMISSGADFVLIGRALLLGITALGSDGGNQVMEALKAELKATMAQLGCPTIDHLPQSLMAHRL